MPTKAAPPLPLSESLAAALAQGDLILTPNQRLSNQLIELAAGTETVVTPRCTSIEQWFDELALELLDQGEALPTALASWQEELLWETVLASTPSCLELLRPTSLAATAREADLLLQTWCIDTPEDYAGDVGYNNFLAWRSQLHETLAEKNLCTRGQLLERLYQAFRAQRLPALERIHLLGFDSLAPLYDQILTLAGRERISHPRLGGGSTSQPPQCLALENREEEYLCAARWAKQCLSTEPGARIGIICPDLGTQRNQVLNVFNEVFEPAAKHPATPRYTPPLNISTGTPLGESPLVNSVFILLELLKPELDCEQVYRWLHSPFWGAMDAELEWRVACEDQLRKLGRLTIRSSELRQRVLELCPLWGQKLQTIQDQYRHQQRSGHLQHWSTVLVSLLDDFGWPGSRPLDSVEHQQQKQFYELLEKLNGGDVLQQRFSFGEAVRLLQKLTANTHFQAELPATPIQILGPLEAAGLHFSHCWVTSAHQHQWPASPSPNPLLPLSLQKQAAMPHASAERELEFAQSLLQHFKASAPAVYFSFPRRDGDRELTITPLLQDLATTTPAALLAELPSPELTAPSPLQAVADPGPAVESWERVRGGSSILKDQAICPFNAFAKYRLGALPWPQPSAFLNSGQRGELVHLCMEQLWGQLKHQGALLALSDSERTALLDDIISAVLHRQQRRNPLQFSDDFIALEQQRLLTLLSLWLEEEMLRPPFEVVSCEQRLSVNFKGLQLSLRLDRIDRDPLGQPWLIDYKTGTTQIKGWLDERPWEPQLPLYAVSLNDSELGGLVFATINYKNLGWSGVAQTPRNFSEALKSAEDVAHCSFSELRQQWQERLGRLSEEFLSGWAVNHYFHPAQQRYFEALLPLNRQLEQEDLEQLPSQRRLSLEEPQA